MALLTVDEFRELNLTESATEIKDSVIESALEKALRDLSDWCGEANLTEVSADNSDPKPLKVIRFREAQEKLAFREILMKISSRFRSGGVQVTEKDMNDTVVNTYEKFSETEVRMDRLERDARAAVSVYFLPAEVAETKIPIARTVSVKTRVNF